MAILREFKCMPRMLNLPLEATEQSTARDVIRYWFVEYKLQNLSDYYPNLTFMFLQMMTAFSHK